MRSEEGIYLSMMMSDDICNYINSNRGENNALLLIHLDDDAELKKSH